jgi:biopolymer transport protein ExbD
MKLPVGGDARTRPDTNNEATVSGLAEGRYTFSRTGTRVLSERELESELLKAYRQNPSLVLVLRVEGSAPSQVLVSLLDIAGRNGLTRYRIGTQLPKRR